MTMRLNVDRKSNRTSVVLAAVALLGWAVAAGAQETQLASNDARWSPWIGCWQASTRDAVSLELTPNKAAPVICFMPAPGNGTVDFVTVNDGVAGSPEHVDANGTRRAVDREGCTGWEVAEFSADAKRIYLHSEHQCTGNRTRTSTGIMSIMPNGDWLDVQGVKVDEHTGVRVAQYGPVPIPAALNADMRAKISGEKLSSTTALIAASDSVRIANVIEASKKVDPLVLQTWLTERHQGFNLDAKQLTQLADAKVPRNVIDVMVALTYPQQFAVNLAEADGQVVQAAGDPQIAMEEGMHAGPAIFMNWDPFYSNSYGYGYGYRYGAYGFGNGNPYGGTWYSGYPIVLVKPGVSLNVPSETKGRMVRGSGYTRGSSGSGGSPRGSTSGGGSSSSGGSSSTGRTAKPRP
jgi:uncharacterized membrane protein YgcG